jgi:hypothetical protein
MCRYADSRCADENFKCVDESGKKIKLFFIDAKLIKI